MAKVVSATEARVHFGALMRQVVETGDAVIVERNGDAQVVMVAAAEYEAYQRQRGLEALDRLIELGDRMAAARNGQALPDPVELVREGREERSRQIDETLGLR